MRIIEDIGNKIGAHEIKHKYWNARGICWLRFPLPCGDYIATNERVDDVLLRKSKRGIEPKKMDFLGTYTVCIDTKKDLQEIIGNVCGKQHARFRDEAILAMNNGIKLIVLVENEDGIKEVRDLFKWQNPRMHRYNKINYMHRMGKWLDVPTPKAPPTSGETLAKAMLSMQLKYGIEFQFCTPQESGKRIIEILTENGANGN